MMYIKHLKMIKNLKIIK